jgi:hypothetical protein
VEPDQVGAERGTAVEPEVAEALRQLGDEQVVPVELVWLDGEVGVVPPQVAGEQSAQLLGVLGDLGPGLPGEVLLGAIGLSGR